MCTLGSPGARWATLALATFVACVAHSAAQDSDPPPDRAPRIRPLGPRAAYTVREALSLSPTVRTQIEQLASTDVIAYVEITPMPWEIGGSIDLVASTSKARFVRIKLAWRLTTAQLVGVLGHELTHALEIASATEITDARSFDAYYARNGQATHSGAIDTGAARAAGHTVLCEMAKRRVKAR